MNLEVTEIYNLNDIVQNNCHKETHQILRVFRQFNELRNKINEEKEYFITDNESIKKKQKFWI